MRSLVRTLIEDVLIFAYCEDDQIEEDFAVAQLERIASDLKQMDSSQIDILLSTIREMSTEARSAGLEERAKCLDQMPSHLGMVDDDEAEP